VLVYFLIWTGFSLFLYPPPPVWGLVCGSPAFTFSGAGLCSPALLVQASCCQLSRFWSCRSFFTRGIKSASSPAAVNTVGDLDSGPDQTCLKIHFWSVRCSCSQISVRLVISMRVQSRFSSPSFSPALAKLPLVCDLLTGQILSSCV
jgi:hypothetical protein